MSEQLTVAQAASLLRKVDHILVLTHHFPDGDTLGSAFALSLALQQLGKTVRVACADPIPEKYDYMQDGITFAEDNYDPAFVCAVDVADPNLLGRLQEVYGTRVDLCIDHHASNVGYARQLLLDGSSPATATLITAVIAALGVPLDTAMATCLYTALATDTGCFKYANTNALAHRLAADFMEAGAPVEMINRTMFDIKSRARVELERQALETMAFYCGGRCAIMVITGAMIENSHANENDMEGLAPLPRQIEGVWVGVTMRQRPDGAFKVSIRTGNHANAADICARLGGGGHMRAAGCTLQEPAEDGIRHILEAVRETVPRIESTSL